MEFLEATKILTRVCKRADGDCNSCIMVNHPICQHLGDATKEDFEEIEKILIEWDKANPIKTNLDALREVFPDADGLASPCKIYDCFRKSECEGYEQCDECRKAFWNAPYQGGRVNDL